MYEPAYYRNQASHARRLARGAVPSETADALEQAAQDFDEIAEDLETGAIKISHPELMPQNEERRQAD
jgi:hypothetical protein